LNLSHIRLCGVWDEDGGRHQKGEYNAEGINAIADALRVNGALTSVDLRCNKLGDEGWGAIFAAICGNKDSKITSLNASDENISPAGVKLIAEALRTSVNGGLTSINMSRNNLTNFGRDMTGIKELAAALGVHGGLTSLDLSTNALCGLVQSFRGGVSGTYTAEGITAIANALRVNGALTSIDLRGNKLCGIWTDDYGDQQGTYTAEGIIAIADALRVNGALTELSIYGNHVGDEGVGAICEAIQSNKETKLASLNFGKTGISPVGANAVAAMVAVMGALTKIE